MRSRDATATGPELAAGHRSTWARTARGLDREA